MFSAAALTELSKDLEFKLYLSSDIPTDLLGLFVWGISSQMQDPLCKQRHVYYFCLNDAGYTQLSGA